VTPMQSICHQLMHEHDNKCRKLKKLWFVWTARDPEVMENMDVTQHGSRRLSTVGSLSSSDHSKFLSSSDHSKRLSSLDHSESKTGGLRNRKPKMQRRQTTSRLARNILTQFPDSRITDEELERELPLDEYESDDEFEFEDEYNEEGFPNIDIIYHDGDTPPSGIQFQNTLPLPSKKKRKSRGESQTSAMPSLDEENRAEEEEVLKLDFFLTSKEMPDDGAMVPFVTKGRPNLKSIFLQMREEAIVLGERRVAICVCAPTRLVTICRKACAKFSDRKVRFDFHSEVFD